MKYWGFIDWVMAVFFTTMGVFFIWLLFVMMPLSLRADSRCLAKGYPHSSVTWDLKSYCMNMEGAVTVSVEKLP